ncbi:MAG: hypothetical protein EBU66_03845 [Bacteroidetes bacterium]|nr:hypothetical protein [Bacteroidota bacterium]
MSGKTYNSKEICEMFNISAPRLLQFRKGQSVKIKTSEENVVKSYKFEPLLEEGKDWYWDGSEVVFRQSSVTKLSKRKKYNKTGENKSSERERRRREREEKKTLNEGEYTVQEIADRLHITVQKIYSLRDISTNKPVSYKNYLIQNKDWKYDDGKVILFLSAKDKIKGYVDLLKDKEEVPKAKRIAVLIGTKVFHLTGDAAFRVIDLIEHEQQRKKVKQ